MESRVKSQRFIIDFFQEINEKITGCLQLKQIIIHDILK